jgi:hypothetical protein
MDYIPFVSPYSPSCEEADAWIKLAFVLGIVVGTVLSFLF